MSTYVPTPSTVDRQWHVIDAGEQVLGRIATVAATLLQGKHKPQYAPFLDTGDFVIITNAAGVKGHKGDCRAGPTKKAAKRSNIQLFQRSNVLTFKRSNSPTSRHERNETISR